MRGKVMAAITSFIPSLSGTSALRVTGQPSSAIASVLRKQVMVVLNPPVATALNPNQDVKTEGVVSVKRGALIRLSPPLL